MIIREINTPLKRRLHVMEIIRVFKLMLQEPDVDRHDIAYQIQVLEKELAAGGER